MIATYLLNQELNKMKKIFLFSCLLIISSSVFAQIKKDVSPSPKIDYSLDSAVVNYKKQQRSTTYGTVTVEGKAINYP